MEKYKFTGEFEVKASKKILYPYLSTASGLAQWMADDVNIDDDKNFVFIWDGEDNRAKLTAQRANQMVRFEFFDDEEDPSYIELKLEVNELTESLFLRVTDYNESNDFDELEDIWEGMIGALKELVGG